MVVSVTLLNKVRAIRGLYDVAFSFTVLPFAFSHFRQPVGPPHLRHLLDVSNGLEAEIPAQIWERQERTVSGPYPGRSLLCEADSLQTY